MNNNNEYYDLLFKSFPDCVTFSELQRMIQLKRTKTYELLKTKKIKAKKIGKDYKILKVDVIDFLLKEE